MWYLFNLSPALLLPSVRSSNHKQTACQGKGRMVSWHCLRPKKSWFLIFFSPEKLQNPSAFTFLLWNGKTCSPLSRALQGQTVQRVRSKVLSCKNGWKECRVFQKPELSAAEWLLSCWVMHRSPLPLPSHLQIVFHHFRKPHLKTKHQLNSQWTTHLP